MVKTNKATIPAATEKVGVFYALGESLVEARFESPQSLAAPGATITLSERSLHQRSHENCTRPCCADEPTRHYLVTAVNVLKTRRKDVLFRVVDDRRWEELTCARSAVCQLFDTWTLEGYLGRTPDDTPLRMAVIIDVTPAA